MAHVCIDIDPMCLIQINNLRVFLNLDYFYGPYLICKMLTHMNKFKPFPMCFISQLLCLVNKNVGTCTYIEDQRLPSESMYVPVYMCVFIFFSETTGQ